MASGRQGNRRQDGSSKEVKGVNNSQIAGAELNSSTDSVHKCQALLRSAVRCIAIIWQIEMMICELQQPPGGGRGGGREGLKFLSAMKRFSSIRNWETSPVGIFAPAEINGFSMVFPNSGAMVLTLKKTNKLA